MPEQARYRSAQRWVRTGLTRLGGRLERRRASKELSRLRQLERFQAATTSLPGCRFALADGPAFVSQWRAIFLEEHYAFVSESPQPRILDCGANIGLASLYWTRTVPRARITAFEPDPVLAALLRANLEACQASTVDVVEAAVWRTDGEVDFATGSPDAGRIRPDKGGTKVRSVRLLRYLTEPIDLLKLDIEGAETDVLRDCVDQLSAIARIFVEFHSFEGQAQHLDELLAILTAAGFRVHVTSEFTRAQPFIDRRTHLGMDLQLNIYAYRSESVG
jgi:FkbM family methyltransferase